MMAERVSLGYQPSWCFQIRLSSCYFDTPCPKMRHCAANKNRTGVAHITQSGDAHWVILNGRASAFAPCRAPTKRYGNPIQTLAPALRAGSAQQGKRKLFAECCDASRLRCVFKYCKALDMPCVFLVCDTSRPLYWGRRKQTDRAPHDTLRDMTRRGSYERLSDYTPNARIRRSRRHHRGRRTRRRHRRATLSRPRRRRDL